MWSRSAPSSLLRSTFGPGERVLDLGSGPGFLAATIAQETGPSGSVCGIDISEPLLSVAKRHCTHPWVEFRQADATQLPFPDCAFDAAISTQVLKFVRDVAPHPSAALPSAFVASAPALAPALEVAGDVETLIATPLPRD